MPDRSVTILRKLFLLFCIMLSVVLFANGLFILANFRAVSPDDGKEGGNNIGLARVHNESSVDDVRPVNLLILGLDDEEARTDVILLFNFIPGLPELNILSIARDTKVFAGAKESKINAVYSAGGEDLTASVVQGLTGIPVNYYITMNFKGFRKAVDILGGVVFNVPFDMDYDDPTQKLHIHLKKGTQLLNGRKAEQLVRYRKGNRHAQGYIDGDLGRIRMQQDFIRSLIKQKVNLKYISRADDIFSLMREYVKTNVGMSDLAYFLPGISKLDAEGVNTYTLPGESVMENGIWYFTIDREKTEKLVNDNFHK